MQRPNSKTMIAIVALAAGAALLFLMHSQGRALVRQTDLDKAQADEISEKIASFKELEALVETNTKLRFNAKANLKSVTDQFARHGYQDDLPEKIFSKDSGYGYISFWRQTPRRSMTEPPATSAIGKFYIGENQSKGTLKFVVLKRKLQIRTSGDRLVERSAPARQRVGAVEFSVKGTGWVDFGYRFVQLKDECKIVFQCDDLPEQTILLSDTTEVDVGSTFTGNMCEIFERKQPSTYGYGNYRSDQAKVLIDDSDKDSWLITFPLGFDATKSDENVDQLEIYQCLKSK